MLRLPANNSQPSPGMKHPILGLLQNLQQYPMQTLTHFLIICIPNNNVVRHQDAFMEHVIHISRTFTSLFLNIHQSDALE